MNLYDYYLIGQFKQAFLNTIKFRLLKSDLGSLLSWLNNSQGICLTTNTYVNASSNAQSTLCVLTYLWYENKYCLTYYNGFGTESLLINEDYIKDLIRRELLCHSE